MGGGNPLLFGGRWPNYVRFTCCWVPSKDDPVSVLTERNRSLYVHRRRGGVVCVFV